MTIMIHKETYMPLALDALTITPNLARPDDFYEALIDMHRDLDESQSQAVNARLILLLANHIGGHAVLLDALGRARADIGRSLN